MLIEKISQLKINELIQSTCDAQRYRVFEVSEESVTLVDVCTYDEEVIKAEDFGLGKAEFEYSEFRKKVSHTTD